MKIYKLILLILLKLMITGSFALLFVIFFPLLSGPMDIWEVLGMTVSFVMTLAGTADIVNSVIYCFRKRGKNTPFFFDSFD